jgi:hypothetical protein
MFAVDANALDFVMKEELEDGLRKGWAFEKDAIEGGARGVMNRREGQRNWWGSGMFGEISQNPKAIDPGRVRQD